MGTTRSATVGMWLDTASALPIWLVTPFVRHWHIRWGATRDECAAEMPGDDVVPRAQFNATRAITIDAPPASVWPWIAQLGYGRAGFYTYDLVDNGGIPSADSIVSELQHLEAGDLVPMFHESHGLSMAFVVESFTVGERMLWVHRPHDGETPDSTWAWRLTPLGDGRASAAYFLSDVIEAANDGFSDGQLVLTLAGR